MFLVFFFYIYKAFQMLQSWIIFWKLAICPAQEKCSRRENGWKRDSPPKWNSGERKRHETWKINFWHLKHRTINSRLHGISKQIERCKSSWHTHGESLSLIGHERSIRIQISTFTAPPVLKLWSNRASWSLDNCNYRKNNLSMFQLNLNSNSCVAVGKIGIFLF